MRVIRSNTEGAIMIMAVFMAMIAIGALYYLVGLGDAILAQERMQDAADATAFSSAVIHARGMNLLALINIIMASLLAILVLLSMLASLLELGAKVLIGAAFLWPPAALGVAPLESAAKVARGAERTVKPTVKTLMKTLHQAQEPLSKAIPLLAASNAITLSGHYKPVVTAATTFPLLQGLPTVDGKFDTLCDKAGEYAGTIAALPAEGMLEGLRAVGVPGFLVDKVKSIVVGMAKTSSGLYADFYCGSGPKPKPPSTTVVVSTPELNTSERRDCDKGGKAECDVYADQLKEVEEAYDAELGDCTGGRRLENLCLQRRRRARTECAPNSGSMVAIKWREADKTRHFQLVGDGLNKRVVEGETTQQDARIMEKENPKPYDFPVSCRVAFNSAFVDTDMGNWNFDPDDPICQTDIDVPSVDEFTRDRTRTIDRPIREFTDILRCIKEETIEAEVGSAKASPDMKESTPQEMCNCAAQGESMFQIRSIVLGDPTEYTADSSKKILVATGGQAVEQGLLSELGELGGNFAAAQAEFYFDDASAEKETWLWSMNWKARMRRLSLARKEWECPKEENTCKGEAPANPLSGPLKSIKDRLGEGLDSVIVH